MPCTMQIERIVRGFGLPTGNQCTQTWGKEFRAEQPFALCISFRELKRTPLVEITTATTHTPTHTTHNTLKKSSMSNTSYIPKDVDHP